MLKCPRCNRVTKKGETTYRIERKIKLHPKGSKIISQQQVCFDCGSKNKVI